MTTSTAPKSQYHHVIPRFILRRYKQNGPTIAPPSSPPRKTRPGNRPDEFIYYYDIFKGELQLRSVGTVYGVRDLYMDASNPGDVMELEKKLADLEGKAAKVIGKIHDTMQQTLSVSLSRREHDDLRKFLFVMYYRKENLALTYWQEDHPENAPVRAWIQEYRKKHGFKTAADFWLHVLRYYLDTSHEVITKDYRDIVQKFGLLKLEEMMLRSVDPSIKFEAVAYGSQAEASLTSIWEAAPGEEFLLGHNTFGLWEGLCLGQPALHRIFVVSPRIAIVHRQKLVAGTSSLPHIPGLAPADINHSDLLDIPTPPAVVSHQGLAGKPLPTAGAESLQNKISPAAQDDVFTFTKSKLTPTQTDAFNAVVLRNVRHDGSLTFVSVPTALATIRRYCASPEPENMLTKHFFTGLIEVLANATSSAAPSFSFTPSPKRSRQRQMSQTPTAAPRPQGVSLHADSLTSSDALSTTGTSLGTTRTPATPPIATHSTILEDRLRNLILAEQGGTSTFASPYSAAHAVWKLCKHDEMPEIAPRIEVFRISGEAYSRFAALLRSPSDQHFQPHPEYRLRKDLSAEDSAVFFALVGQVFNMLGVTAPPDRRRSLVLLHQASMIGFAEKLAQTRHDTLAELLRVSGLRVIDQCDI